VIHFKKAHDLDKDSIEVTLALARGYLFQHEFISTRQMLDSLETVIIQAEYHLCKMYFDTDIQIHYRLADDLCRDGNYMESLKSLENMRECFDTLKEDYKDKFIRKKLRKAEYTLRILANKLPTIEYERIRSIEQWLNLEAL
jgi:LuxR family transcriptional regulator, glucitol operon activator